MRAEIIAVGTEIIMGSITNTNTVHISKKLLEMGIETHYHTSVDDDYNRLESVFKIALDRSDLIILSGGLGPTEDDLTKEAVSKVLNTSLILDLNMQNHIKNYFDSLNREMTINNLKQAMKPLESSFIINYRGIAPGVFIEYENKKIILLPGPPQELEPMFDEQVISLIKEDFNIVVRSLNVTGIRESSLEIILKSLDIYMPKFTITTYVNSGYIEIKIIGRGTDIKELNTNAQLIVEKINSKIGDSIFSYDNKSLAEALIDTLNNNNLKIAVCESCTGGSISEKLTSIDGASKVFDRGIVTYSNSSKIDELSVSSFSIEKHGPVSQEIAFEMAEGLLKKTGVDLVISTTGYVSPNEKFDNNSLVYICIMSDNKNKIYKMNFPGNRKVVIERSTNFALEKSLNFIKKEMIDLFK